MRCAGGAWFSSPSLPDYGSEFFLSPPLALTLLGLIATVTSVMGNEAAIRLGRRRLIAFALMASALCAALLGVFGPRS